MRKLHPPAAVASMMLVVLVSGCGGGSSTTADGPQTSVSIVTSVVTVTEAPEVTTTAEASVVTTIVPAPSTVAETSDASGDPLEWDGVDFDYGQITGLSSYRGDRVVEFDRYQLYDDSGSLRSAADFVEEPVVFGNSDVPGLNENPTVRVYRIADDAEVLTLANPGALGCDGLSSAEPIWAPSTVDELFAAGPPSSSQVALTFDDAGSVIRIRISESC